MCKTWLLFVVDAVLVNCICTEVVGAIEWSCVRERHQGTGIPGGIFREKICAILCFDVCSPSPGRKPTFTSKNEDFISYDLIILHYYIILFFIVFYISYFSFQKASYQVLTIIL